jgi:hypothetical protein
VASFFQEGNESSASIKDGGFLVQLNDTEVLKAGSPAESQLIYSSKVGNTTNK